MFLKIANKILDFLNKAPYHLDPFRRDRRFSITRTALWLLSLVLACLTVVLVVLPLVVLHGVTRVI